jgi:hypothetical protein
VPFEGNRAVKIGKGFIVVKRPYLRYDPVDKIEEPPGFHVEKLKLRFIINRNLIAVLDKEGNQFIGYIRGGKVNKGQVIGAFKVVVIFESATPLLIDPGAQPVGKIRPGTDV